MAIASRTTDSTASSSSCPSSVLGSLASTAFTPTGEAAVVSSIATKENDGDRSRQRCQRRLSLRIVLCTGMVIITYHLMWTYWLAGVFVPDYEVDESGRIKYRRHPEQLYKVDNQNMDQKKIPADFMDGILEGYLTLIDISLPYATGLISNLESVTPSSYQGVKATFCHIAWDLQERDPTQVPLFRDLQQQSPLCAGTTVRNLDFYHLVQMAKDYDSGKHNFTATKPRPGHQVVAQPTAVLFHETRSGSTLVSNLVASSLPPQVRSYSETTPPLVALMACDLLASYSSSSHQGPTCDKIAQLQLIRDVFYMMGRVTRPQRPQYIFYKIQSIGVRYIHLLTEALPDVPWAFIYRDSVEILMSHFKNYQTTHLSTENYNQISQSEHSSSSSSSSSLFSWDNPDDNDHNHHKNTDGHDGTSSQNDGRPVCLRSYGKTKQDPILLDLVQTQSPERNVSSLSPEEYCAAHLASLAQRAVSEYQVIRGMSAENTSMIGIKEHPLAHKLSRQWFLNYAKFPHVLWEEWLPVVMHLRMTGDMIHRMQETANIKAKSTSVNDNRNNYNNKNDNNNNNNKNGHSPDVWHEDSTLKQARAPDSIKNAAQLFMDPVFQIMNKIEETQHI